MARVTMAQQYQTIAVLEDAIKAGERAFDVLQGRYEATQEALREVMKELANRPDARVVDEGSARDPRLTMTQWAAQMVGDLPDEDDAPDPEAIPVAGVLARIEELYGNGPSIEEMIRRRDLYNEQHPQESEND